MKLKSILMIIGVFFAVLLVACAKAPSVTEEAAPAPSTEAGSAAGGEVAAPAAPEAKFKITKQVALKNPSRVTFTVENIGDVSSSIELTVGLVYARKVVESKTTSASLNIGESKELTVEFPSVTNFVSYTIEGAGLINPVKPTGTY